MLKRFFMGKIRQDVREAERKNDFRVIRSTIKKFKKEFRKSK